MVYRKVSIEHRPDADIIRRDFKGLKGQRLISMGKPIFQNYRSGEESIQDLFGLSEYIIIIPKQEKENHKSEALSALQLASQKIKFRVPVLVMEDNSKFPSFRGCFTHEMPNMNFEVHSSIGDFSEGYILQKLLNSQAIKADIMGAASRVEYEIKRGYTSKKFSSSYDVIENMVIYSVNNQYKDGGIMFAIT